MNSPTCELPAALDLIRDYHQRTKHRFEAYARSPGALDWDEMPAPFRHYPGCPQITLPLLEEGRAGTPLSSALARPFGSLDQAIEAVPVDLASVAALLQLSLGLTAWKNLGPDRWAVRANPSSGNLHPTEAWLLIHGIADLADGLYHYRPENHSIELRAAHAVSAGQPRLAVALSSVMWREAWKYGERAFRYCQLDTGHAAAGLRMAAACLGWGLHEQPQLASTDLAALLGVDRLQDYPARKNPATEIEEAELLLAVSHPQLPAFALSSAEARELAAGARWQGVASSIDRHPMYRWPVINAVAEASRQPADSTPPTFDLPAPQPRQMAYERPAAELILGRRSAQRFDHYYHLPRDTLRSLLQRLQPVAAAPWDCLSQPSNAALLLFIQHVEDMAPGLYLLLRDTAIGPALLAELGPRFDCAPVAGFDPLYLLAARQPVELQRIARSLHCHQELAANACFAAGMLCAFDENIEARPWAYRQLYRQCGLLGQQLYLEAEAHGLRGTGIGCFFDDPVHELLGLSGQRWQSLYHFTVGSPVIDPRIASTPAYADRQP